MLSGLFHKAIAQSGSALNPWTCGIKGTGKLVAQRLGINYTNETDLLETLKTMPVGNLNLNHVCKVFIINIHGSCFRKFTQYFNVLFVGPADKFKKTKCSCSRKPS